ncbi:FUSC family protein [Chelatococcus reniformis]|uniref:FUSC family protein n=2 Tax=Chelatococcus reniformis TaxID=1494448 RepID=A0A916UX62_9HYPH|nr:FUSC family protein [Chelatococcus reniformis]
MALKIIPFISSVMRRFIPSPSGHEIRAAVRVGLAVGLPLLTIFAMGRLDLAVFAAFGALTALYGHSEPSGRRVGTQLVVAVALTLTMAAATFFAAAQGPTWLLGVLLVAVVLCSGALGAVMGWVPRGEIFFVLVLLVLAGIPATWTKALVGTAVGLGAALFSVALTVLDRTLAGDTGKPDRLRDRIAARLASIERRQHVISVVAATVGVLAAWLAALALGIGHPYWASVVVTALMPALLSSRVRSRVVHVLAGTLGGVAMAAVIFAFEPSPLELIVMIMVCQAIAELFIAKNFGLALLFLSPLAIGMSNLGRGLPWGPLMADRLVEAGLGAAIGLAVIFVVRELAGIRLEEPSQVEAR